MTMIIHIYVNHMEQYLVDNARATLSDHTFHWNRLV